MSAVVRHLGPASACPQCATFAVPEQAERGPGGIEARYRCPRGHRWPKLWMLTPFELALYAEAAA